MDKCIIFTGGGSTGHVTINLDLIPKFIAEDWTVIYIGSHNGIEKSLLQNIDNVKYISISTGKLRRYLDTSNLKDPFKVLFGILQSYKIIKRHKPRVIFSKGGFVSVPVVIAGWLNKVPVVIHESDVSPGLANRIAMPFSKKIITTFKKTEQFVSKSRNVECVGPIVRGDLKNGDTSKGLSHCNFKKNKPVLLVMGGSQGSKSINQIIRKSLKQLLNHFQVIHVCGKGQVDDSIQFNGYKQFEYIKEEFPDVLSATDIVVSRAGSNSIFEFLHMTKPMLLIPLTKEQSRGDQIQNANLFKHMGFCEVMNENEMSTEFFIEIILKIYKEKNKYIKSMQEANINSDSLEIIFSIIKKEGIY